MRNTDRVDRARHDLLPVRLFPAAMPAQFDCGGVGEYHPEVTPALWAADRLCLHGHPQETPASADLVCPARKTVLTIRNVTSAITLINEAQNSSSPKSLDRDQVHRHDQQRASVHWGWVETPASNGNSARSRY